MKHFVTLLSALFIAGAIAGVGGMAIKIYTDYKNAELANQARYQCGQLYRYSITDKAGATVSYPMEVEYKKCLETFGVK